MEWKKKKSSLKRFWSLGPKSRNDFKREGNYWPPLKRTNKKSGFKWCKNQGCHVVINKIQKCLLWVPPLKDRKTCVSHSNNSIQLFWKEITLSLDLASLEKKMCLPYWVIKSHITIVKLYRDDNSPGLGYYRQNQEKIILFDYNDKWLHLEKI